MQIIAIHTEVSWTFMTRFNSCPLLQSIKNCTIIGKNTYGVKLPNIAIEDLVVKEKECN